MNPELRTAPSVAKPASHPRWRHHYQPHHIKRDEEAHHVRHEFVTAWREFVRESSWEEMQYDYRMTYVREFVRECPWGEMQYDNRMILE